MIGHRHAAVFCTAGAACPQYTLAASTWEAEPGAQMLALTPAAAGQSPAVTW
jgi:hypothetical protein